MGKSARTVTRATRRKADKSGKPDDATAKPVGGVAGNDSSAESGHAPDTSPASGSVIDPASISGNDSGSNASGDNPGGSGERVKRKYTRRGTGGARASSDTNALDSGFLKDILLSGHAMLAGWTKNADWDLDDAEAEKIATRAANVARHYDVPEVAQKTKDWVMFIQACGAIYGPRIMSQVYEARAKNARPAPQHRAAPANVAPAPTAPNAGVRPEAAHVLNPQPRTTPPPNAMNGTPLADDPGGPVKVRQQPGLPSVALDLDPKPKMN